MKRPTIPSLVVRPVSTMPAKTIIEHFFFRLRQSGWTYCELSEKAGISVETLKGWHSGKSMPRLDVITDCFAWLGFTLVPTPSDVLPDRQNPRFELLGFDWLELERERDRQKRGHVAPPEFGSEEWERQNSFDQWPRPTPEEIAAESQELARPIAERVAMHEKAERQRKAELRTEQNAERPVKRRLAIKRANKRSK